MVIGLTLDVPGDGPGLRINLLQETSVVHLVFEDGAVDGGERFDGDKEVGSGGTPGRAVRGEAPARDNVVDVGVVLELPAPGVQDAGEPWQVGPDEALVGGQPFEGRCRGVKQGLVRGALMGAHEGAEGLRDGKGEEEVRPRAAVCRGGAGAIAGLYAAGTGGSDGCHRNGGRGVAPHSVALREAVTIMPALALLDGADDLCGGRGADGGSAPGTRAQRR